MSLPGLVKHPVSTVGFFPVQGGIHLFLCLEPRIIWRSQSEDSIFVLQFLGESSARTIELDHSFAVGELPRQLVGQLIRGVGIDGQRHEPGQLLDDVVGRTA